MTFTDEQIKQQCRAFQMATIKAGYDKGAGIRAVAELVAAPLLAKIAEFEGRDGHIRDCALIEQAIGRALRAKIAELETSNAEFEDSFDLRSKSDMRAIQQWQAATGKELIWPSSDDLCVWLMARIDELEAKTKCHFCGAKDSDENHVIHLCEDCTDNEVSNLPKHLFERTRKWSELTARITEKDARIAEIEPDAARLDILEKLMLQQWPQVGLRTGDDAALFGCNRGYEPDESEYIGATLREVIDNAQHLANTGA